MVGPSLAARPSPAVRRWPVLAVLAALTVALHLWELYRVTGPPSPRWLPHADKFEHLVGFGLPLLLVLLAAEARAAAYGRRLGRRPVLVVVGLFAVHAVVSELVQGAFYTSRIGDPYDAAADLVGVALGVLAFRGGRGRA